MIKPTSDAVAVTQGHAGDAIDFALGHCGPDEAFAFLDDWRADRANEWPGYVKWLSAQYRHRTAAQPEREAVLDLDAAAKRFQYEHRNACYPDATEFEAREAAEQIVRAALTTPAPAEDDDPDDHLGGKLAAAVERELDRIEQRNSTRQDFTPAFDRELARKVIMAGFGLFGCRGWTTASGYQWMGLLEALGLDKARPVSAAPAVSTDEIDELLYSVIRMPLSNKGGELVRWRKTMSGRLSAILSRLRGEGE